MPETDLSPTSSDLVATDLHRSFTMGKSRIEVLRGLSLHVKPGERVFLVGASGSGKTTLLYTLAGLEEPEKGRVEIGGQSLYECSRAKRSRLRNTQIGYVFQNYHLLPDLTALENVMLPSMIGGKNAKQHATELLNDVGLGDRTQHLPSELSGGEQQRVAIARALINDPPILFADEPTGNLDSATGNGVMDTLLGTTSAAKKTLIVVTHDPKLANFGDRQIRLADGRIAA